MRFQSQAPTWDKEHNACAKLSMNKAFCWQGPFVTLSWASSAWSCSACLPWWRKPLLAHHQHSWTMPPLQKNPSSSVWVLFCTDRNNHTWPVSQRSCLTLARVVEILWLVPNCLHEVWGLCLLGQLWSFLLVFLPGPCFELPLYHTTRIAAVVLLYFNLRAVVCFVWNPTASR